MKLLKILLLTVVLFSLPVVGEESINSDVRIEIVSQIKKYKEDVQELTKKAEESQNEKEKKLLIQQIELLKNKIKNLKRVLERYESSSDIVG